jgi:hypothetical protein
MEKRKQRLCPAETVETVFGILFRLQWPARARKNRGLSDQKGKRGSGVPGLALFGV